MGLEEVNVKPWFPYFTVQEFDDEFDADTAALDQPLSMEVCMLICLPSCDLMHTKNLKNTRSRLCDRLGLHGSVISPVVESS